MMPCPQCGGVNSWVTVKRRIAGTATVLRHRQCDGCGKRFVTHEAIPKPKVERVRKPAVRKS